VSSSYPDLPGRTQRGAALIVALVVVLLVVMLATRVSSDYLVLFRTVENQNEQQQARAYLRGAELVAKEALLRDLQLGDEVDSALELWGRVAQVPLPEGLMSACLADLQARLNLNDLQAPAGEYSAAQKRFIRLLQVVDEEIDSVAAVALANAVFDWIDADNAPRYPGGAEALDYLQQSQPAQPYRPANQAFASVTELRLVKGFSNALVAALTPHVSVWGNGNLNLNTLDAHLDVDSQENADAATAVPVMLRTLNNATSLLPLNVEGARLIAAARTSSGGLVQDLELFDTGTFGVQEWELDGVALTTSFFELTAVMRSGRREYGMTAVLRRAVSLAGVPEITVMSRRYGVEADRSASCAAALP
jgi:general secretion pathway protein K